jgi:lipid-binding SYLF domain-containing protein
MLNNMSSYAVRTPFMADGCNMIRRTLLAIIVSVLCVVGPAQARAQGNTNELHANVVDAIALFKKQDSTFTRLFDGSQGYVVFPSVAKGGFCIGAAHGDGEVYVKGTLIGTATLTQVTIGLQLGGQVYSEVVFFDSELALNGFKAGRYAVSAQATAVAAAEGCAANAKYDQGIAIFTMPRGGLMYEASVGGQKFNFKPIVKR